MDSTSTPVPAGDDTVDLTAEAVVAGEDAVDQVPTAVEAVVAAETVRLTSEDVAQAVVACQDAEPEVADEAVEASAEPVAEDAGASCTEDGESVMVGDVTVDLAAEAAVVGDEAVVADKSAEPVAEAETAVPEAEPVVEAEPAEAAETTEAADLVVEAETVEPEAGPVAEAAVVGDEAVEQVPEVVEPVAAETVRLTPEDVAQAVAACQDAEPVAEDEPAEAVAACQDAESAVADEPVEPVAEAETDEPEAGPVAEAAVVGDEAVEQAPEVVEPVAADEAVAPVAVDAPVETVAQSETTEPGGPAAADECAEPASESVAEPTVADEPLPASIAPAAAAPEVLPASIAPATAATESLPASIELAVPVSEPLPASIAPTAAAPEPLPASIEPVAAVEPVDAPADLAALPAVTAGAPAGAAPVAAVEPSSRDRRRLGTLLGVGAGLLLLLWGGTAAATTQHIFSGSTVSGVDVGGMSTEQAQQAVTDALSAQLDEAVTVSVPGDDSHITVSDTLVPAQSGVSLDAAASVDALTSFTLNPVTIIDRLTGTEVQAVTAVDTEALTAALNSRLSTLSQGTIDATVTLDGATPVLTPSVAGTGVDVAASVDRLRSGWPLGQQTVELVSGTTEPAVTDAEAQALIDDVLTPLLASDITVTAAGTEVADKAQADAVLTPAEIASTVSIVDEAGTLSAHLTPNLLHDAVVADMGSAVETAPADATFTIEGSAAGTPVFVPGNSGVGIDSEALATAVLEARDGQRRVTLPVTVTEPDHNEPEAQWGITQVVGEYATPFYYDPVRTQNLTAGTAAINGTVVMPGETFSLTEALGPVDAEHGFAAAGVYTNGVHSNAMGGGLSQVATTVFNAGFEAGMDDVEHHPHSVWFTRYPAGREATLWTGVLDVKWTNSTPYAVLVNAWVSDGEVHVRLWSTHYYDVSISSSEHTAYRPVRTETSNAPGCEPYEGGQAGFDVTVTRSRTAPDGTRPADDVLTTSYAADNALVCTS